MENCQYIKVPYMPVTDIPTIGNFDEKYIKEVPKDLYGEIISDNGKDVKEGLKTL